jgi:hypothetical protein
MINKNKKESLMELLLNEHRERMLRNGRFNAFRRERGECEIDHKPVVKLFVPGKPYLWLLGEINPDDHDQVYAVCDIGNGEPTLQCVSLFELGLMNGIVRDDRFIATKSIGAYALEAQLNARILA